MDASDEGNDLFEKCNRIWDIVSSDIKKDFDRFVYVYDRIVYDKKF